ncbi:hypothetical protein FH972_024258 [Carpinus fangiana]|uniref:ditrans,polycis-polyprenyl diphosphate synthase [(2E,6E)-farnesyldiphosphate specific] n=1 Tax=Carpinus fangiana TaxID=176857 RepID=A0A5N6KYD6_9ROSI|nr:hypothetical protein FH972_024258 [Carpinus fangiana]
MPGVVETQAFRRGVLPDGRTASKEDREQLLKPYLPSPNDSAASTQKLQRNSFNVSRPHLRPVLASLLHKLIFSTIQLVFSIYITIRQTYHAVLDRIFSILYHHHRTPELIRRDVKGLSRVPKHLSVIVDLNPSTSSRSTSPGSTESTNESKPEDAEALMKLIGDVAEISCWCACTGIPMISIYERTGVLRQHIPTLHRSLTRMMQSYFPPSSSQLPSLHIRAPHHPSYSPPSSPPSSPPPYSDEMEQNGEPTDPSDRPNLNLLLLSASDGRETLVDLTKTLTEMAQRGKLRPADVTSELIDAEVTASSCGEPDLLVLMAPSSYRGAAFRSAKGRVRKTLAGQIDHGDIQDSSGSGAGGDVCLRGYPPWQVRLTEIFHVQDNSGVDYQGFLRALHRYAKAEMRLGR